MKNKIIKSYLFFITLLLATTCCNRETLVDSCESEQQSCKVVMSASIRNFEEQPKTRNENGIGWKNNDCIYLLFESFGTRVNGKVVYDLAKDEWTLYYEGDLKDCIKQNCTAYHFESNNLNIGNQIILTPQTAVYNDTNSYYSKNNDVVYLNVSLSPSTGRIRFKGISGQKIKMFGTSTYCLYDVDKGTLTKEAETVIMDVGEDGYTEYAYCSFNDASRLLTILYDNLKFTKICNKPILDAAQSGFMDIPTSEKHEGWNMSQISIPTLSTIRITDVQDLYASVEADVISTGNDDLIDAGFVYSSTNDLPQLIDQRVSCGNQISIKRKLSDLNPDTKYHVRAYAINKMGVSYSETANFTTEKDLTIWDGKSVASSFAGGSGSKDDPILIATAAQLKLLADNVNNNNINYRNVHFKLTRNLDLNNYEWTPIGKYWISYGKDYFSPFSGIFDGSGHIIKNLKLEITLNHEFERSTGLFGYITYATIKNLAIDGNITGYFKYYTGAVTGSGKTESKIENCINYCKMNMGGGITGDFQYCYITNCVNYGDGADAGLCNMMNSSSKLNCNYSYWLFDVSTNSGNQYSGPKNNFSGNENNSFSKNPNSCLIYPSYTKDLVEKLNEWVYMNTGKVRYNEWKYESIDGFARPALIPE